MEEIVSIKKAASMLGVTTTTLRNWDKNGKLAPLRTIGGHRRYRVSDLEMIYEKDTGNIRDKKQSK